MSDETQGQLVEVADNPDQNRYEVRVGGELAGIAQYRPRPGALVFVHTEIDDRFEGRALAASSSPSPSPTRATVGSPSFPSAPSSRATSSATRSTST
jgi:hypothetical protein